MNTFGTRLKQKRIAAGMTQDDLANLTGLSQPQISNLERGRNLPTLPTLDALERLLGAGLRGGDVKPLETALSKAEDHRVAYLWDRFDHLTHALRGMQEDDPKRWSASMELSKIWGELWRKGLVGRPVLGDRPA
jgi:transcriptional regulator with XRE-family HTH domain